MRRGPSAMAVVEQRAQRENVERVADVDGDRCAVQDVERRASATLEALVLDVVVHEEGVVEELERDGGAEGARRRRPPKARAVAMSKLGRSIRPARSG